MADDTITLSAAVSALITEAASHICEHSVLAPADDEYEITNPPVLIFVGPTVKKSGLEHGIGEEEFYDEDEAAFTISATPVLYDLHFEVIAAAESGEDLLDVQQAAMSFLAEHDSIAIDEFGSLPLDEVTPIGGGQRVNLSNIRQATGEWVLRGFPVYDTRTLTAYPIESVTVDMETDSVTVEEPQ